MPDVSAGSLNLDLLIERTGRSYRARILDSPAGEVSPVTVQMPFTKLELENFLLRMSRSGATTRSFGQGETRVARAFGERLFDAVFRDQIGTCLRSSLDSARNQSLGLRLRLRLSGEPELANLPWEYLYDRGEGRFLALSDRTPIVRYVELPRRVQRLRVEGALNILVMISSPRGFPQLNVERERSLINHALAPLVAAGRVSVEQMPDSSMAALQRHLRRGDYHIFHFIGHGGFDERAASGTLVLESAGHEASLVSSEHLSTVLGDHQTLRLVLLNARETVHADELHPFSGVALRLVQQGVPAVVAMQFEITDEAAIAFSEVFYEAVADSYPIDTAVAQGRKGILNATNGAEWGTPVVYMRSQDGRLFEVARRVPETLLEPEASQPFVEDRTADGPLGPQPAATPETRAPEVTVEADGAGAAATTAEQVPTAPAVPVPHHPAPAEPGTDGGGGNRLRATSVLSLAGAVAAVVLLAIGALVVAGVIKVPAFSSGSVARSPAAPTSRPSPPGPGSPTTVVKTLNVPSTDQWTDTGIDLKKGAQVTITGTGQVRHNQSQPPVGPDGDSRPVLQQYSVLPNVPHAALIGMVDDPGHLFPVGQSFYGKLDAVPFQQERTGPSPRRAEGNPALGAAQSSGQSSLNAPATGRLFLGVNDTGVDNNSGYFTAEIKVVQS